MSKELSVGFIGFGEAGSNIAKGLKSSGLPRIFAYDISTDSPKLGPRIQERARDSQTMLVDSSNGIEPIMAAATARRQDWCAQLGLSSGFGPNGPDSYRDLLEAIRRQTHYQINDLRLDAPRRSNAS